MEMDLTEFLSGFSQEEIKATGVALPEKVAPKVEKTKKAPKEKATPKEKVSKPVPFKVIDLTEKTTAQVFRETNPWQEPTKRQQQGQRFTTCLKV
jgi:hypothetical protein